MHVSSQDSFQSSRVRGLERSKLREFVDRATQLRDVIRLELGDSGFDTPAYIREACKTALDEGHTRYSSFSGLPELREVLADKLRRENDVRADPATEVVITPGATGALYQSLQATVDAGDEVLLPDPYWPSFPAMVELAGGKPVFYPCAEADGFTARAEKIAPLVTARTKVLLLNSPSNPTGGVSSRRDMEGVCDLARQHDLFLISDEVYERILYGDHEHVSPASLHGMAQRTLTIMSVSKTFAMTGWRVGYAAGPADVVGAMSKLNFYTNAHPNTPAQRACAAAFTPEGESFVQEMVAIYRQRRDYLRRHLNELPGISCLAPAGSVFLFPNIAAMGMSSMDVASHLLEEARVAAVPGTGFGAQGEGHLRICFSQPMEVLEKAVERMYPVFSALMR